MIDEAVLEQRLAALEEAVAQLFKQGLLTKPADNWLDMVKGSITDDEAFAEALEFGRKIRQADFPRDEAGDPL